MGDRVEQVHRKIKSFQQKYYLNIFIRGGILTLSALLSYFLIVTLLENSLWLDTRARLFIFVTFFAVIAFCFYLFLKAPLRWWATKKGLNDEQSARIIGDYIPSIKDRLLNLIQLSSSIKNSELAYASVQQKSKDLEPFSFDALIDLKQNKHYLKYLVSPVIIIIGILLINQKIITQSTQRIVHFNQQFSPQAPFNFVLEESLTAFYNEDFLLKLKLEGEAFPENVYLIMGSQRIKLESAGDGNFFYRFEKVQEKLNFQLQAAGFYSRQYEIALVNRPELLKFKVDLVYPKYLQRKAESVKNAGSLEVPEGTVVKWNLSTAYAQTANISFASDNQLFPLQATNNQSFIYSKKFTDRDQYEIVLQNEKSKNKDRISYQVDVVKDQYPQITVSNFKDSILYKRVVLGGTVGDDYGITELMLHFKILDENQKEILTQRVNIPISKNVTQQNFFYNWSLDSLKLKPGEQLNYYLQAWDNDGVNGRKSTRTASYTFLVPTEDNLIADIDRSKAQAEKKIDQSVSKADKLHDQIEEANQKLKGKQNLDWQDKKMLEDIIQQKQSLDQMIDQLKEDNKLLEEKKNAFTEQDERIREKAEQIQKLMNDLLDEETKKLFEELQKLLKENTDVSQIQKLLDKINKNTNNLEKELERTLELFKQLQYDFKMDQTIQEIKKEVEDQKALMEKTDALEKTNIDNNSKSNKADKSESKNKENEAGKNEKESQELAKEQEKVKEDFKQTSEKIKDLKKLGEELKKDEELPSEESTDQVREEQQQSQEMLEQNNPSNSKQSQKKALQKMQKMQQQMEGIQNSMTMEMDMGNLEALRQILHGLIKLSFDQENLLKNYSELQQNDPRFNKLAQEQLKLKDDAKVLEDSLLALGKRDAFMGSFITREIGELNDHLEKVTDANKERRRPQASNEMQLSMTSINNLALMLDSHYDMMMQMMANAKPSMKKSKQKGGKQSLSQLQQQLNQKIQELKSSGKSGRQLSEDLAEMAAEQERIRKALQEMQEKMKNEGKMPGGDLPSKMEQTEMDLVNKQLTDQLIKRQKEIMTRLLETEKSMREQDTDNERKGETAKDYDKEIPKAFEEYLRLKEKEVELLKTVPPKLYPYYKKEVSDYFKRMDN